MGILMGISDLETKVNELQHNVVTMRKLYPPLFERHLQKIGKLHLKVERKQYEVECKTPTLPELPDVNNLSNTFKLISNENVCIAKKGKALSDGLKECHEVLQQLIKEREDPTYQLINSTEENLKKWGTP